MYIYKIIQKKQFDNNKTEKRIFFLTNTKKYDDYDFEQLLKETRNYLRNKYHYVDGRYMVMELRNNGFKEIEVQAEEEFDLENYW